ncbi:uncharacterized protein TRIADDRAFT_53255 [Trichoplax adhaerens]|uniref:Uncharacterized protein n=1 Tax=Trichoplax adhaerens TaxID=10228 RepID=B3RNR0_TRIAD|nr:predicted protein [Trichoplax adhaerens]EDV28056.1 predicted protein [Trichoplax adhaerens]|eukprot:XP_002109890.1 predicted protein [Trichoplax adhaerens]
MHDSLSSREKEILEDVTSDGDYIDQMCNLKSRLDDLKEQVEKCERLMDVVEEKFDHKIDAAYKAAHAITLSRIIRDIRKRQALFFTLSFIILLIIVIWRYDEQYIFDVVTESIIQAVAYARSETYILFPKLTVPSQ